MPFIPGVEAAGTVSELGLDVTAFAVGDRVAWVYAAGSYAEEIVLPAAGAVPVPGAVPDEVAASVMMQGLTAQHFVAEASSVAAAMPCSRISSAAPSMMRCRVAAPLAVSTLDLVSVLAGTF